MKTDTYLIEGEKNKETNIIVPIEDIGNGEESIVINITHDGIGFEVLDDQDNVLYSYAYKYADLCNDIEARDFYLKQAAFRHPASSLHVIDGGGNK
jgi:hypothetical protein